MLCIKKMMTFKITGPDACLTYLGLVTAALETAILKCVVSIDYIFMIVHIMQAIPKILYTANFSENAS